MVDLSVVIVSWNCLGDLKQCLESLKDSKPNVSYELIIVDNASTDGTVPFLQRNHPRARLILNAENRGFATANNQAFEIADARYVLLLNPDTIVRSGAMDALVRFLDEHPDAGAAGPALKNRDGTAQATGVRFPNNMNLLFESFFLDRMFPYSTIFGRHKELFADPNNERQVDYVQGACMIVRMDVVRNLGGLDEQFFMYFEEVDWCWRIRKAGLGVLYCPGASVTHLANTTLGHYDERRVVHYHRSLLTFYRKHYSFISLFSLRLILILRSVMRIAVWGAVAVVRPSMRSTAMSSLRGYLRVMPLLFGGREIARV